jgi:hypothetical protein
MLTSTWSITLYGIFFAPTFFISRFLTLSGRPKRDAAGAVIASGEDLNQPGLTEYAFDVIYVTCKKNGSHIVDLTLIKSRGMSGWHRPAR